MLKFKIATPEKIVYENEIKQVSIPTLTGEITILPKHRPLVTIVQAGEMRLVDNNGEQVMAIAGGFVEVKANGEVTVLADNVERAQEIDLTRAETARLRAEEQLKQAKQMSDVDFARLQSVLDRELNRIRIARKYRQPKIEINK